MTADLAKNTDLHVFAEAFPDRFYQMGTAEQLLMGAAAGMAREGMSRSSRPMPRSPRGAPMTLFAWRLRRNSST
jgi:hypothetical protein